MVLPQRYNRILRRYRSHSAAWEPVSEPYTVGSYGFLRRGVFERQGHIKEYGVTPELLPGNDVPWDFVSSNATTIRLEAGVPVLEFSDAVNVDASLEISFGGTNSLYIKAAVVSFMGMVSPASVASALANAKNAEGKPWNFRYRVIRSVYTADHPAILFTMQRDTKFVLKGKAALLKQLEAGKGSLDIAVQATADAVVKVPGGTGPIALDLFRVTQRDRGDDGEKMDDEDLLDFSEDWGAEEDDSDLLGTPSVV